MSSFFPLIQNENKIVNSENMLIVYVQWEHNGNEQMVCKCKTKQRYVISKQDLNLFLLSMLSISIVLSRTHTAVVMDTGGTLLLTIVSVCCLL